MPLDPDQHQVIENIRFEPVGAGTFLIAGAHLDAQMPPLGVVGEDLYGGEMIRIFKDKRINTDNIVQQKEGTTNLVIVLVNGRGNHVFLGQIGQGPDVHFSEEWKNTIRETDAVHGFSDTFVSTQGHPLKDVLAIANAMDAAKAQKFGSGRQIPTLNEVRKVLDTNIDF